MSDEVVNYDDEIMLLPADARFITWPTTFPPLERLPVKEDGSRYQHYIILKSTSNGTINFAFDMLEGGSPKFYRASTGLNWLNENNFNWESNWKLFTDSNGVWIEHPDTISVTFSDAEGLVKCSFTVGYVYFSTVDIYSGKTSTSPTHEGAPLPEELPSEILPESIEATPATIEDLIGTKHQLTVEILPDEAEDKTVSFISDKNEVATVDETGLVTLKGEGTATITIASNRVPELSTQVIVNAIRPYEKPVISQLSVTPTSPKETDSVTFSYHATYDRATFKAEEWENKQERYEAGRHTVRVRVQDSNCLWSDWMELSFNVAAVYQEPTISNLRMSPANPGYGEAVEFTYDYVLDPRLTLQKENWTNKQPSYEAGVHTVKLSITDSEGQTSNELTISFSIERPYDQPIISNLTMTPANPQPGEEVSFFYDKNLDSRLQVKHENWVNKQVSYDAGVHTVKLSITDTADQVSNELSLTFSIEQPLEAPVVDNLRITPATPNAGEKVSFIYDKVIDDRLTLKTENWVGKQDTYEAGQHTVTLSITDSADQVSNTLSLTFEVAYVPEIPVLNSITMTPTTPIAGDAVNFTYQATLDPKATVQEEIWEGKQESYEAGDHEVALTIVDSFNQRSNRVTLLFTVENPPQPEPEPDPDLPPMPSEFPIIYDIVVDPPQPRAGELLSYSYTVGLEKGTSIEKVEWSNRQLIYEEAGVVDVALKVVDSKGQSATQTITIEVLEASETPQPPKPTRVKHLEVTRWDSASKRFLILEGREK